MWQKFISFVEQNQFECLYVKYVGIRCPGCGMQTSVIHLLKGNFLESFKAYPPLFPLLIMFAYLICHVIFKFKNGAKNLIYLYFINIFIIFANYIYQLINN